MQITTPTDSEKIPTLYIGKNLYIIIGIDLKTLRLKNRITSKTLAKDLNISVKTLKALENGEINKPYEYIHTYCRHFSINPNLFIKKYNIECNTFYEKLEYLKLYYGVRNLKNLDVILNTYAGAITEYINKNRNKGIQQLIINKYEEIKKK